MTSRMILGVSLAIFVAKASNCRVPVASSTRALISPLMVSSPVTLLRDRAFLRRFASSGAWTGLYQARNVNQKSPSTKKPVKMRTR